MRKSRLSKYKQNKLLKLFVAGTTARTACSGVAFINLNLTADWRFCLAEMGNALAACS